MPHHWAQKKPQLPGQVVTSPAQQTQTRTVCALAFSDAFDFWGMHAVQLGLLAFAVHSRLTVDTSCYLPQWGEAFLLFGISIGRPRPW